MGPPEIRQGGNGMGMTVKPVTDQGFGAYGRIITGYDFKGLLEAMEKTPLPEQVIYVPSVPELEALSEYKELEKGIYGQMPIQIGYCNGHNKKLNAVEYHRDSAVRYCGGKRPDPDPRGDSMTSARIIPMIPLKWRPFLCRQEPLWRSMQQPFTMLPAMWRRRDSCCVVVLPRGTNMDMEPIEVKDPEDRLLFAVNKWLIGHEEGGLPEGAFIGLKGENLTVD